MNISICCPSYKRPKVETLNYIKNIKIYVCETEYEAYKEANNENANIVICKKGIQGNLCRIRNHILKTEFENGADVVCIIDDDLQGLYLWEKDMSLQKCNKRKLSEIEVFELLGKYSTICSDLGFRFWGANCNQDAMSYMEYTPFGFSKYIGGPFQVFLNGNECFYDENLPLKEDYDMTLQQCNKYRGCLRLNFLTYNAKQSEQKGGCATYRNMQKEKEQFQLLQKKWGKEIVKEDFSNKGKTKKEKRFDYNPIIKVPIKGI